MSATRNLHKLNSYYKTILLLLIILLIDKGYTQAVFELNEQTFDQFTRDKDVMIVAFYMPWCHHCQSLIPEWQRAGEILASNREYVLGKVNCWEDGKSLCDKLKIEMYPDIRLYRHGVYIESFEGDRTATSILEYAQRAQATTGAVGSTAPAVPPLPPVIPPTVRPTAPPPPPPPPPPPVLPPPPGQVAVLPDKNEDFLPYQSLVPPPLPVQQMQFPQPQLQSQLQPQPIQQQPAMPSADVPQPISPQVEQMQYQQNAPPQQSVQQQQQQQWYPPQEAALPPPTVMPAPPPQAFNQQGAAPDNGNDIWSNFPVDSYDYNGVAQNQPTPQRNDQFQGEFQQREDATAPLNEIAPTASLPSSQPRPPPLQPQPQLPPQIPLPPPPSLPVASPPLVPAPPLPPPPQIYDPLPQQLPPPALPPIVSQQLPPAPPPPPFVQPIPAAYRPMAQKMPNQIAILNQRLLEDPNYLLMLRQHNPLPSSAQAFFNSPTGQYALHSKGYQQQNAVNFAFKPNLNTNQIPTPEKPTPQESTPLGYNLQKSLPSNGNPNIGNDEKHLIMPPQRQISKMQPPGPSMWDTVKHSPHSPLTNSEQQLLRQYQMTPKMGDIPASPFLAPYHQSPPSPANDYYSMLSFRPVKTVDMPPFQAPAVNPNKKHETNLNFYKPQVAPQNSMVDSMIKQNQFGNNIMPERLNRLHQYIRPSMYKLLKRKKPLERFIKRPVVEGRYIDPKQVLSNQNPAPQNYWSSEMKIMPAVINQQRKGLVFPISQRPISENSQTRGTPISKARALQIATLRARSKQQQSRLSQQQQQQSQLIQQNHRQMLQQRQLQNKVLSPSLYNHNDEPLTDRALIRTKVQHPFHFPFKNPLSRKGQLTNNRIQIAVNKEAQAYKYKLAKQKMELYHRNLSKTFQQRGRLGVQRKLPYAVQKKMAANKYTKAQQLKLALQQRNRLKALQAKQNALIVAKKKQNSKQLFSKQTPPFRVYNTINKQSSVKPTSNEKVPNLDGIWDKLFKYYSKRAKPANYKDIKEITTQRVVPTKTKKQTTKTMNQGQLELIENFLKQKTKPLFDEALFRPRVPTLRTFEKLPKHFENFPFHTKGMMGRDLEHPSNLMSLNKNFISPLFKNNLRYDKVKEYSNSLSNKNPKIGTSNSFIHHNQLGENSNRREIQSSENISSYKIPDNKQTKNSELPVQELIRGNSPISSLNSSLLRINQQDEKMTQQESNQVSKKLVDIYPNKGIPETRNQQKFTQDESSESEIVELSDLMKTKEPGSENSKQTEKRENMNNISNNVKTNIESDHIENLSTLQEEHKQNEHKVSNKKDSQDEDPIDKVFHEPKTFKSRYLDIETNSNNNENDRNKIPTEVSVSNKTDFGRSNIINDGDKSDIMETEPKPLDDDIFDDQKKSLLKKDNEIKDTPKQPMNDFLLTAISRDPHPWDKRAKVTFKFAKKSTIPTKPKLVGVFGSLKRKKRKKRKRKRSHDSEVVEANKLINEFENFRSRLKRSIHGRIYKRYLNHQNLSNMRKLVVKNLHKVLLVKR